MSTCLLALCMILIDCTCLVCSWFAEPLDLVKKLLLAGLIMFVSPGTVVQSSASIVISVVFLVLHAYVWPYPHPGANILKLITEAQVVLVMGTTLVFRFPEQQLESETIQLLDLNANLQFYQTTLEIMLVATLIPIVAVLVFPTDAEKAQRMIQKMANKSTEQLEAAATTSQARERIRAAVGKVALRASVSNVIATLGAQASAGPPTAALICQQIDERAGEPTGTLKPGELIGWWVTAEPAQFTPDGQSVVPYSRANTLREALAEMEHQPGDELDFEDVSMLLVHLIETEHERISDASIGKSSVLLIPP